MDSIINSLKSLFTTYGFRAATIVVLSVIIVNLSKRPIVKLGVKLASERGLDKSVVTRHISCLPFITAFLLTAIWELADHAFHFGQVDFGGVLSASLTYGALAVATYETVKKQLEAYAAKKNAVQPSLAAPQGAVEAGNKTETATREHDSTEPTEAVAAVTGLAVSDSAAQSHAQTEKELPHGDTEETPSAAEDVQTLCELPMPIIMSPDRTDTQS